MIIEMIYFFQELDLLELRFNELDGIVDKHIIIEYPFGYDRQSRPMYYNENKERFKKYEDKIIHIIDGDHYGNQSGLQLFWNRKNSSTLMNSISFCKDDDFIFVCDDDVIINRDIFNNFDLTKPTTLYMKWCMYWFNYYTTSSSFAWTLAAPYSLFKELDSLGKLVGYNPPGPEPIQEKVQQIENAGWHFAKCGGAEKIIESIRSYPHQDMNSPALIDPILVQERIDNGWGWNDMSRGTAPGQWNFLYEDYIPENFPKYIEEHPEIYKKYFCFDKGAKNLGNINWL